MLHHKHLLLCLWLNHIGEITSLYPHTWHSGTLNITVGQFQHLFTVIGYFTEEAITKEEEFLW